ncbi:MAG TPA: glycerol-3-phosphate 1-O-acyltransferase PlsY [Fimbriimonadaceae bacterium]|nr:glycerol-3-phosphate 1-O-acyltransferase PlsY [Fimbriimonadaceae bacterium]
MTATGVLLIFGAYILGGIPLGVIVARAHGIDIFKVGSGNIGATNVYRAVGGRWAGIVFAGDIAKGLIPTLLARTLFPTQEAYWVAGGASATLGHCFSPFLRFRGGKGVACLLGMVLGISVVDTAWAFGTFLVILALTRYVSLGSLIGVPTAAVVAFVRHENPVIIGTFAAAALLTVLLHRKNIKRLLDGTESKFGKSKPKDPPDEEGGTDSDEPKSPQ